MTKQRKLNRGHKGWTHKRAGIIPGIINEDDFERPVRYEEPEDKKKYHFFWKSGSPFSQWHPSVYELDDVRYVNAEQGMMHGKALLFGDDMIAAAIMQTSNPHEIKRLGRQVKGFQEKIWKRHREEIVFRNSLAKFSQNENLREALLSTTGLLVEASPQDSIWGIGLLERKARLIPEEKWKGLNLLGKILTRVRETMLEVMDEEAKVQVLTIEGTGSESMQGMEAI